MPEQWQLDDTQPIRPISREEQPVDVTCHVPVTTLELPESQPTDMTPTKGLPVSIALPLIEQALEPQSELMADVGRREHRFAAEPTLLRPIKSFDNWYEIEQIGDDPDYWCARLAMESISATQFKWPTDRLQNCHGHSTGRKFGINPNSFSPVNVVAHELSHIALGHTTSMAERAGKTVAEVEVEAELSTFVMLALIGAVSITSVAVSKWYLHHWMDKLDEPVTDEMANRVGDTALKLLWAGGWCR